MKILDFLVYDVQKTSTIATSFKRGVMGFLIALASSFFRLNILRYKNKGVEII